jgi:RHH-type proline utilization regulon transcriptional repressor/proline dehydrogenase/delta 1-pyrroline-5-carboxylate dehydrogenase
MFLATYEAGKTLFDANAEIREAIDFCRYYAQIARETLIAKNMPGPTGESNILTLQGRGVIACISPWNFPLAIFVGQLSAALVAGNTVIAKPAGQTPLIAARAVELFHQAGVPEAALQLVLATGSLVGEKLIADNRIAGVVFTGSTKTGHAINCRNGWAKLYDC